MKRYTVVGLCVAMSLALISAVLLSAQDVDVGDAPVSYTVHLTEYMMHVDDMEMDAALEFEVGKEYQITFINDGSVEHEILIGQNALVTDAENNYHLDFETNLLDDVEMSILGEMDGKEFVVGVSGLIEFELNPGLQLTIDFTLPEDKVGDWELACFVSVDPEATEENPGITHFDLGMKMPVVVKAASE